MLNTLLETHHYELGQKTLSFITVDLQQLITEAITELKPLAIAKNITLLNNAADNVPQVKGDRLELQRSHQKMELKNATIRDDLQ